MSCRLVIAALFALLTVAGGAVAQEKFDCPATCEQGAREALEKCRLNHPGGEGQCPKDDGRIPEECRKICDQFSNLSLDELVKKLPPNYNDILEGK